MQAPNRHALRTTYGRYVPGTDRPDVGAGYTATIAAVLAPVLYVASVWLVDSRTRFDAYSPATSSMASVNA